jgi:hypothetical protein
LDGWVKLHRALLDGTVFRNPSVLKVWIWCLLKATHEEFTDVIGKQKVTLQPGQFIFGRFKAGDELGMNPRTVYDHMLWLAKNESINIKPNNKFTLVTIVNWEFYQSDNEDSNIKSNNNPTTNQHIQEQKKDIDSITPYVVILSLYNEICISLRKATEVTDQRKKSLNSFWKWTKEDEQKVRQFFTRVEASDFLTGRTKEQFRCGIDWIIGPKNRVKITEGNYDNRRGQKKQGATQQTAMEYLDSVLGAKNCDDHRDDQTVEIDGVVLPEDG